MNRRKLYRQRRRHRRGLTARKKPSRYTKTENALGFARAGGPALHVILQRPLLEASKRAVVLSVVVRARHRLIAGRANFAASIGTFGSTSASSTLDRPFSQLTV